MTHTDSMPGPPATPSSGTAERLAYADFWPRVVAFLMDLFVISLVSSAIAQLVDLPAEFHLGPSDVYLSFPPAGTLVGLAYFVGFWGWLGQTPGMMRMNLRVVRADDGERIGILRALVRCAGLALSILPFFIGLMVAAADPKTQGWHDKIASTVVVTPY